MNKTRNRAKKQRKGSIGLKAGRIGIVVLLISRTVQMCINIQDKVGKCAKSASYARLPSSIELQDNLATKQS